MIILTYWLPFCPIETQPIGKAKPSDILAQALLMLPKLIYLTEYYIWPAILVLMNKYPCVTAHYSPLMFL